MADRAELSVSANELSKLLREVYGGEVSERFARDYVFEALHLGLEDVDDFGTLIFLECHEVTSRGAAISDHSLRRIMHRVRQRLVRRARHELQVDPSRLAELASTAPPMSSEIVSESEISHRISELSPDEALVLHLYAIDGKTPAEIGQLLGVSVATVYRRMKSARDNLVKLVG